MLHEQAAKREAVDVHRRWSDPIVLVSIRVRKQGFRLVMISHGVVAIDRRCLKQFEVCRSQGVCYSAHDTVWAPNVTALSDSEQEDRAMMGGA
jgi:hypothetical protein